MVSAALELSLPVEITGPVLNGYSLLCDTLYCFCMMPVQTTSSSVSSKLRISYINSYFKKQSSFPL